MQCPKGVYVLLSQGQSNPDPRSPESAGSCPRISESEKLRFLCRSTRYCAGIRLQDVSTLPRIFFVINNRGSVDSFVLASRSHFKHMQMYTLSLLWWPWLEIVKVRNGRGAGDEMEDYVWGHLGRILIFGDVCACVLDNVDEVTFTISGKVTVRNST